MATHLLVLAAVLSVFIGMAVGLLGGGGSILTTPLLVYVLGYDAKQAITASLFLVAITSLFGLVQHARDGRVQWRTGLIFGFAGMAGAFLGGQLGSRLPGTLLLGAFAVMMGTTAVAMIRGRKKAESRHQNGLPFFRIVLDGFVVGLVTGIVGAGGGFLVVPALALLGGLPMGRAVATSLLVVAMKSTAGFAGYALQFGAEGQLVRPNPETEIDWGVTLLVTSAAVVGALFGSRFVKHIHPDRLRKGFGWFVLVMAVFMLSQEVGPSVLDFASGGWVQLLVVVAGMAAVAGGFAWMLRRRPSEPPPGGFHEDGSDAEARSASEADADSVSGPKAEPASPRQG